MIDVGAQIATLPLLDTLSTCFRNLSRSSDLALLPSCPFTAMVRHLYEALGISQNASPEESKS